MNNSSTRIESIINEKNELLVDLFHGTSTLFLDSIIKNGLGGINPVSEWKILELAKEVYELSQVHLQESQLYQGRSSTFKALVNQSNSGAFNFQHGDTYLSPSKQTAARYAINNTYGSELLSCTIFLLKELLNRDIEYVKEGLYHKFKKIFGLIEAQPSPLLIQVKNVNISSLLNEQGQAPKVNLEEMQNVIKKGAEYFDSMMQQTNFRLTVPVLKSNLTFRLINIQEWQNHSPQYNLYEIKIDGIY